MRNQKKRVENAKNGGEKRKIFIRIHRSHKRGKTWKKHFKID
jgi:hypothetical protein